MESERPIRTTRRSINPPVEESKTPEKREKDTFFLTLTEKCKIYLDTKDGKIPAQIAREMSRNPGTVSNLLDKAKKRKSLENQHAEKGRFAKGSTKLEASHIKFILQWIQEGIHNSSHEVWVHLCSIQTLKKVGYNTVNKYLSSLGKWVKPRLTTIIS